MKDFLIIGNLNAVTYKEVFPLIKAGEVRLGVHANTTMKFVSPYENVQGDGNEIAVPAVTWFTTLHHDHVNPPIVLTKRYNPTDYPKYDNYDAIEVSRTKDIPCDYYGVMGVPISFLDKWCTEQFEIVGTDEDNGNGLSFGLWDKQSGEKHLLVNGKRNYSRILIKRK